MERLSFIDIVADKHISDEEIRKDLLSLKKYKADINERKFCGNPFLYHYQMTNLCRVRVSNKKSLYEKMNDEDEYRKLYEKTQRLQRTGTLANRLFEAHRFNNPVVLFKPSTAKFLYKKFGATKVLDPTAGWGGRMLGAWALDIEYTGIDTNVAMKDAYNAMIDRLQSDKMKMIFDDCLNVDFSTIDYDFVLTSPPYINLELYENMTRYESDKAFYTKFLIPLLNKCLMNIKNSGFVCFNISPQMYSDLLKNGYRGCDMEYDLLQQKRMGKDKQDKIYCWK